MPDWLISCLLLALGGGAGANARFWLGRLVARLQETWLGEIEFPWATLFINVTGSALLGIVAAAYLGHADPTRRNWYLLLGTGFCGGFTTFSTFSLEALELARDGKTGSLVAYVAGSAGASLLGIWLAMRAMGK